MMGLWDLGGMAQALPEIFGAKVALVPLDPGPYGAMAYPRWLPLLKFRVQWYGAAGYGNVFAMHTRALGGRMELATLVFTPNVGGDVPLLLVDVMSMGKKRAAFVEYYDCTKEGAPGGAMAAAGAKFTDLPDRLVCGPAHAVFPYQRGRGSGWDAALGHAGGCGGSLWGELPQAHRGPGSKPGRACGVYRADDPAGESCFRHIGTGAGKGGGGAVFPHPGHAGNL